MTVITSLTGLLGVVDHVDGGQVTAETQVNEGAVATNDGSEIIETGDGSVILDYDSFAFWAYCRLGFD